LDETARLLGVSRRTVYSRIRSGALLTLHAGRSQRVLTSSIDAMLQAPRIRRVYQVGEKDPKSE
jgi:excisionase family DNA binding protein